MKRILSLSICLLVATIAFAQTQQGYVKTKGRMVNGKIVHGQGLKGATVSIKGRTAVLVNADDGAFSFPVPGTQFRVDSVRKKGYQLVDLDALSKTYKHSANPIYLVMETPERQLQDQLAAERKIRRTLTDQLHQHEDEIEALKEQQRISEEEYRQALQKLYEETDQNEQLVKDMVERYSTIDYDQLSEFDQKISEFILNGELVKADSMLRTKGDINQRIADYQKHKAINAKEKEELSQRQEQLEQSELLAQKELEDLANDCYRKFEIFKMQHLNDSAAYYIEMRAWLDTTNVKWLIDAGEFNRLYQGHYETALNYYEKALFLVITNKDSQEQTSTLDIINNIGIVLGKQDKHEKAIEYFNNAIDLCRRDSINKHSIIAKLYNNIGIIYGNLSQHDKALEYAQKALHIWENFNGEKNLDVAAAYFNIGSLYTKTNVFDSALYYLNKSLTIQENNLGKEHPLIARTYNNIGHLLCEIRLYDTALQYNIKSLKIRETVFGLQHPDIAESYNNIGYIYTQQNKYEMALEYYQKALNILESIFGTNHSHIATITNNMGSLFQKQGQFDKAYEFFNKSLVMRKEIYGENSPEVAISYNSMGILYVKKRDYDVAIDYFEKAYSIWDKVYGPNHSYVATIYNNIGYTSNCQGNYDKAIEYFNKCLNVRKKIFGKNHPDVATCYNNIGLVYYSQGEYGEALEFCKQALSIQEDLLGSNAPETIKTQKKISEIQAKLKEQENEQKTEE